MTEKSLRIGIAGISGRVGQLLVEEVQAAGAILAGARPASRVVLSACRKMSLFFRTWHLWQQSAMW